MQWESNVLLEALPKLCSGIDLVSYNPLYRSNSTFKIHRLIHVWGFKVAATMGSIVK